VIEQFSELSLEDNRQDLPNEDVGVTSQLQAPSSTPGPTRPKRNIQPTKRYLESIQSQHSAKKGKPCHTHKSHQANLANTLSEPPNTLQEVLSRLDSKE